MKEGGSKVIMTRARLCSPNRKTQCSLSHLFSHWLPQKRGHEMFNKVWDFGIVSLGMNLALSKIGKNMVVQSQTFIK